MNLKEVSYQWLYKATQSELSKFKHHIEANLRRCKYRGYLPEMAELWEKGLSIADSLIVKS